MPEIPNVVPGEPVESDWGNDVRDRITQRFADATARTASLPFPQTGQLSWLDDPGQVYYFDGADWITLADDPALALKVSKSGDTMTGLLTVPQLVATTRLQGPLEVFYTDVSGVLAVTTVEDTVDTFTAPRAGRYLIQVTAQGTYASLTDADVFTLRLRSGAGPLVISQVNMFRAWGAPGVTTGHFNARILFRSLFVGAGTEFDITVARFGTTGGAFLTDLDRAAQNVENIA